MYGDGEVMKVGGWGITLVRMSLDKCGINGDCSRQYAPNLITKDMGMGTSRQRQAGMEWNPPY